MSDMKDARRRPRCIPLLFFLRWQWKGGLPPRQLDSHHEVLILLLFPAARAGSEAGSGEAGPLPEWSGLGQEGLTFDSGYAELSPFFVVPFASPPPPPPPPPLPPLPPYSPAYSPPPPPPPPPSVSRLWRTCRITNRNGPHDQQYSASASAAATAYVASAAFAAAASVTAAVSAAAAAAPNPRWRGPRLHASRHPGRDRQLPFGR